MGEKCEDAIILLETDARIKSLFRISRYILVLSRLKRGEATKGHSYVKCRRLNLQLEACGCNKFAMSLSPVSPYIGHDKPEFLNSNNSKCFGTV